MGGYKVYRIDCNWIENGIELTRTWLQEANDMDEAYDIWRELFWDELFDPLRIRIVSFCIKKYY